MPETISVNLPVKTLAAATRFHEAIGRGKNEQPRGHQVAMAGPGDS